jgi:diguanylate cyclase (GGDEF)-like protein
VQAGVDATLAVVCSAVRDALGFHAVVASLREPGGLLSVRAAAGWGGDARPLRYDEVVGFLDAAFAVEGCYLLPSVEAERRLGRAWNRHRLLVPLHDETGEVIGLLWAGDPADGLPVSAARLRALRAFANQAAGAVLAAQSVHELRFLADHDPLTRLLNRRAFVTRLDGEVARATRYGRSFALVLCDLDGFKALNDRLGHPAGDEALTGFARTLLRALRRGDEAFRIGGDEFALLVAEATEQDAREVVQRVAEQPGTFTASFGVALCPEHAADAQTLFRLADAALYHAKRSGSGLQFVA